MTDEKFFARLQAIARQSGFAVKTPSLPYVAKMIRAELEDDAAASAISRVMKDVRLTKPDQFWNAEQMLDHANATAMEKLEASNAKTYSDREAERAAAERAKPKVVLSEAELRLPPEIRLSLIHEREAAAVAPRRAGE